MARIHKTPVTVFLVSATIPLIPGAALYRTMNWMLMKEWAKFRKTESIRSFCGEHGSRNDADDHCVPDGVAVDVQAEENVIQYRNSPFTNHRKCVTIFPYGKLMEEESTCVHRTTGKSPEDFLDAGCDAVEVIDLRQSEW